MSKPDLAGDALAAAPQADHDLPQGPVVHVEGPLPEDRGAGRASVSPKWSRLSIAAASRLCAAVIAWKSPVNWRLIVFDGSSRLAPPPVAPPCGRRPAPSTAAAAPGRDRLPIRRRPCARPIDVVVFPSPAGVGVIAETRISLPGGRSGRGRAPRAGPWPCRGRRARDARRRSPGRAATSAIGRSAGSFGACHRPRVLSSSRRIDGPRRRRSGSNYWSK